jgi:hypothetical protein
MSQRPYMRTPEFNNNLQKNCKAEIKQKHSIVKDTCYWPIKTIKTITYHQNKQNIKIQTIFTNKRLQNSVFNEIKLPTYEKVKCKLNIF